MWFLREQILIFYFLEDFLVFQLFFLVDYLVFLQSGEGILRRLQGCLVSYCLEVGEFFFFSFFGLVVNVDIQFVVFKKDDSKLFSWSRVGQKLFNQEKGEEDGEEVIQGYDFYFKLVVFFFDLVKVKIGEEGFEKLFFYRVKLFRYDKDINQWKEKGIGEMKILRYNGIG